MGLGGFKDGGCIDLKVGVVFDFCYWVLVFCDILLDKVNEGIWLWFLRWYGFEGWVEFVNVNGWEEVV